MLGFRSEEIYPANIEVGWGGVGGQRAGISPVVPCDGTFCLQKAYLRHDVVGNKDVVQSIS